MKANSIIEKGKRYEKHICEEVKKMGWFSHRTSGSGNGLEKGDIFSNLPFLIEAKNHRQVRIMDWIDQAKLEATQGNWDSDKWAVVFRDFRQSETQSEDYVVISFPEFLKLLKKDSEPIIKQPDRETAWKLKNVIRAVKELLKNLESNEKIYY